MSNSPSPPFAENGQATAAAVADAFDAAVATLGQPPASAHCRRCGTAFEPDAERCVKCQSFAPANQAARTTGLRARYQPPDLRMTADELIAGILSDLGGEEALSTLERAYVRRIVDVDTTIRLLIHHLATRGLTTPGGRVRDAYDRLLAGITLFDRLSQRVGLNRRQKPVASLADVLAQHEEQH